MQVIVQSEIEFNHEAIQFGQTNLMHSFKFSVLLLWNVNDNNGKQR